VEVYFFTKRLFTTLVQLIVDYCLNYDRVSIYIYYFGIEHK